MVCLSSLLTSNGKTKIRLEVKCKNIIEFSVQLKGNSFIPACKLSPINYKGGTMQKIFAKSSENIKRNNKQLWDKMWENSMQCIVASDDSKLCYLLQMFLHLQLYPQISDKFSPNYKVHFYWNILKANFHILIERKRHSW